MLARCMGLGLATRAGCASAAREPVDGQAAPRCMTPVLDFFSARGSLLRQRDMATCCKSLHVLSCTQGNRNKQLLSYCCAYMELAMIIML